MKEPNQNQALANRVRVVFPTLEVREASSEQLWELIESTFRVEEQAAAVLAESVAELYRRGGRRLVETVLRESGRSSPPNPVEFTLRTEVPRRG